MCFQWLRKIFRWLRGRCPRRNRGYSHEISSHHGGGYGSSGGVPSLRGHGSFFCGGDGSVVYSGGISPSHSMAASSTCSVGGGYRCGGGGSVVIASGDRGEASAWGTARGSVLDAGGGPRYSIEDSGNIVSSGGGGGSSCYSGRLGYNRTGGSSYWGDASSRDKSIITAGGSSGSGYCRGPEMSSGGSGSSHSVQQKCPVVIPDIKSHHTKQDCHWPASQK
ncbi:loricrin-like [Dromaius novaehollandiae]|uniref:loricrin-like n=1 Tax=Dromaius novaehollandiae TaxID=8790 RepID=UPI00311F8335